jgi:CheY-like chemotaxis protein
MTANATPETAAECVSAGMDGRILKPIDRAELFEHLETLGAELGA